MSQIYYFSQTGRHVLYKISDYGKNWFEGEFLYPFPGVKFDYFTEDVYLTPNIIGIYTRNLLEDAYLNLEIIFSSVDYLREISAKFCSYNRRNESERGLIREVVTEPHLTRYSNYHGNFCNGKTIRTCLSDIITKFLLNPLDNPFRKTAFEYDDLFSKVLARYKYIRNLEDNTTWHYDPLLHELFFRTMGDRCRKLKFMRSWHTNHHIPIDFIDYVDFDEYITYKQGTLPLIIATQFGTTPKITRDFTARLEGQEVVFLHKSQLSGYEHSMIIKRVINGKYELVETVTREETKTETDQ